MQRVRVGIAGTSAWTERVHLRGLAAHPAAEIAAICGRNEERVRLLAARYGSAAFTDFRRMIAEAGLDALVVATPDDLHVPVVMAALDAGLHVLCEKPLAPTAAEARALYKRAQAAGVLHLTMFTYRWLPPHRFLRRLLDDGFAGRPLTCEMEWLAGYGASPAYSWRFDATRANGVLGDLGSHLFDLARWYLGPVATVEAELAATQARSDAAGAPSVAANDEATLRLTFSGGARGSIRLSAVTDLGAEVSRQRIRIAGDAGALELELSLLKAEVRGQRGTETQSRILPIPDEFWERVVPHPGPLSRQRTPTAPRGERGQDVRDPFAVFLTQPAGARLLVDAIVSGDAAVPSFADGWLAQEAVDAALRSARVGAPVRIPAT